MIAVKGVCTPCDSTCKTCNGPTSQNCLTCLDTWYYLNNVCYKECPVKYFKDQINAFIHLI